MKKNIVNGKKQVIRRTVLATGIASIVAITGVGEENNGLNVSAANVVAAASFKDVPNDHWAFNNILWAKDHGVVKGFPDGTFKPNNHITEAEFLSVLIRSYSNLSEGQPTDGRWDSGAYSAATVEGLKVKGTTSNDYRSEPILRGDVARLIAVTQGQDINHINDAIDYVLEKGISGGMFEDRGDKYANYGAEELLTRAQVAAFINRLDQMGLTDYEQGVDNVGTGWKDGTTPQPTPDTSDTTVDNGPIIFPETEDLRKAVKDKLKAIGHTVEGTVTNGYFRYSSDDMSTYSNFNNQANRYTVGGILDSSTDKYMQIYLSEFNIPYDGEIKEAVHSSSSSRFTIKGATIMVSHPTERSVNVTIRR